MTKEEQPACLFVCLESWLLSPTTEFLFGAKSAKESPCRETDLMRLLCWKNALGLTFWCLLLQKSLANKGAYAVLHLRHRERTFACNRGSTGWPANPRLVFDSGNQGPGMSMGHGRLKKTPHPPFILFLLFVLSFQMGPSSPPYLACATLARQTQ